MIDIYLGRVEKTIDLKSHLNKCLSRVMLLPASRDA